jgi:translocator protein
MRVMMTMMLTFLLVQTLQSIGLTLVWRALERDATTAPVLLFLAHVTLGDLWNRVFFGEKRIGTGLGVM